MTDADIFGIKRFKYDSENDLKSASECPGGRPEWGLFSISSKGFQLFCRVKKADVHIEDISVFLNSLKKIADEKSAYIICLNEENIAGFEHIESALFHAARSWFEDKPISNSYEMEVLLYASGTRQCSIAGKFGLKKGENKLIVCVCRKEGPEEEKSDEDRNRILRINEEIFDEISNKSYPSFFPAGFTDCSILAIKGNAFDKKTIEKSGRIDKPRMKRLMKLFDITKEEIESVGVERLEDLVLEKVALLDVSK